LEGIDDRYFGIDRPHRFAAVIYGPILAIVMIAAAEGTVLKPLKLLINGAYHAGSH
jgi:hypothetical protein